MRAGVDGLSHAQSGLAECFLEGRPLSEPEAVSSGISAWLRGGGRFNNPSSILATCTQKM
jgi:hypothetical protein